MKVNLFKNSFIKIYFIRIVVVNFFSFIYLIDTTSLDNGIISLQSFFYSLQIHLLYFFIVFETISAFLGFYGYDYEFLKLISYNLNNLNYPFVKLIFYENINFFYYLTASILTLFFLEKKNYFLQKKKFLLKKKNSFILLFCFVLFLMSIFNPNLTHIVLFEKIGFQIVEKIGKGLPYLKYHYTREVEIKNNVFRNDNWIHIIQASYAYKNQNRIAQRPEVNIENIINSKPYNNIYIIINESYPNFKNESLRKNLFNEIIKNNDDLIINKYKKKYYRGNTTQVAEYKFFCGNKEVVYDDFLKNDLKDFVEDNNCWINSLKHKKMTYIHSYRENFFNRIRYKSFFDQSYFYKELKNLGLSLCDQKFHGICDYDVINNMQRIVNNKNNNFVIFLTLNNHIPTEPLVQKEDSYISCEKNYPLNVHKQFCILYNNQFLFNQNLSNFISNMEQNDLLIFFADTPPKFPEKLMIHFEEDLEVFTFSKK